MIAHYTMFYVGNSQRIASDAVLPSARNTRRRSRLQTSLTLALAGLFP